jgi:histidine ammonia-lyase
MDTTVTLGTRTLTVEDVVAVARTRAPVAISDDAISAMEASRAHIDRLARSGHPVYGVSTGFGALATKYIDPSLRNQLQRSLIRSHAAGTGAEVESEIVRAMMLLRLATLCTGRTGVRPSTALAYAGILNAGITPVVPEYGSLGCSGDLAPLAHCALALMGEGVVRNPEGVLRCAE